MKKGERLGHFFPTAIFLKHRSLAAVWPFRPGAGNSFRYYETYQLSIGVQQIIPNVGIQINHYLFADDSAVWAGLIWAVILLVRDPSWSCHHLTVWLAIGWAPWFSPCGFASTIRLNQASGQGSLRSSSKKVKAEVARLPEALLWTFDNITAGTFYWPKQVPRLGQIQGMGKWTSSFHRSNSKVSLQRGLDTGVGRICDPNLKSSTIVSEFISVLWFP